MELKCEKCEENQQLRLKLNYFQQLASRFCEKSERAKQALKTIEFSPIELDHKNAQEELKIIIKL